MITEAADVTMAQASSAQQREPSMEEILASIRRIIEDNDSGRKPPVDFGKAVVEEQPEQDAPERTVIEVEAFKPDFRVSADPRPVAFDAPKPTEEPVERHEPFAPSWSKMSSPLAEKLIASVEPAAPQNAPVFESRSTAERLAVEAAGLHSITPPAAAAIVEPVAVMVPVVEPAQEAVETVPPAKSVIVSEHVERQVAASFGELSDAFAARGKKSFDDIAQEMMRPMLQEWLDNNLPTLVERLVREEIERVARGAQ